MSEDIQWPGKLCGSWGETTENGNWELECIIGNLELGKLDYNKIKVAVCSSSHNYQFPITDSYVYLQVEQWGCIGFDSIDL